MRSSPVCLDASFLLRLLLDREAAPQADALWETWHREGRRLTAPTLLYYEVTNALHRYAVRGVLSPNEVEVLLDLALRLDIELISNAELHRRALQLARTFSLPATCDAHYLALAEQLDAELWTADERLVRAVRDHFPRIRKLGEAFSQEDGLEKTCGNFGETCGIT